ncbi:MAG: ATP-binding cassette domain-containing protein, partial [Clostridia bacterium]|nr:ATP-binding cassette domain-containing protein [Clostridia bacterium]
METIKIKNLTFSYPSGVGKALDDISFTLPEGSFNLIIGESGSGKTTLLKLLKNEIAPVGEIIGNIEFFGRSADSISFDRIGFVSQFPDDGIVTDKVWHEMAFGLENMGLDPEEIRLRVGETASYFGIGGWYHQSTDTLSGGQKQLLNLASVMVMRPDILLLDEPTAQLDPIAASDFLNTLKRINRESGVTVIISEHRLEEVFPLSDNVLVLENGKLAAKGSPNEVCNSLRGNPIFSGFPTPARLWSGLGATGVCPLTVKEGRTFLTNNYPDAKGKTEKLPLKETEAAVELDKVTFRYERTSPDVINEMTLKVGKGEIFAILGENGSGKTTALDIIAGLRIPYAGTCRIFGKKIKDYKGNSLYRKTVALLPQDPTLLFAGNTVIDDLRSAWKLAGGSDVYFSKKAEKWINLFGIEPLLSRHPYDLSGGEQQKCALVKLMLREPRIILLDEPTKGLDAAFKRTLGSILGTLKGEGITVIMVTHDV